MQSSKNRLICKRMVILVSLVVFFATGCANNGGPANMTDTAKGGLLGGAGGAALGAIIDHGNPLAGALIGAAGGALSGALVGHFMDDRKKNLEQALTPQINAGEVSVQILKDNALLVTQTGETAFAPASAVVNPGFIPTLKTIANVVNTYGKTTIAVLGHPDDAGTEAQRREIADQRAEAVRNMFLGMGVSPALVTASGYPNSKYRDSRVELVIQPLISG